MAPPPTAGWQTWSLSRLRYYQTKFDLSRARPFKGEATDLELVSADGTRLAATALSPGSPQSGPHGQTHASVLAHGLFAHRRLPSLQALAESLTRFGPVWTIDLRGHGASGGACTLGELEADDVAAATAHAKAHTDFPVVTIGLSMGAAAVLRAAAFQTRPDAVMAISSPGPWRAPRPWGAWKTSLSWRVPGARQAAAAFTGFRLSGQTPWGPSPLEAVGRIAPTPVLIVHGTDDPFFPPGEARALFAAAGEPKGLAIYPGGGHAEGLFSTPGQPVDQHRVDSFADDLHAQLDGLLAAARHAPRSADA